MRDFRTFDVFAFNVIGFCLGLALVTNPPFIGSFAPGAKLGLVLLLGGVIAVVNGLVYGWYAGMIPTTGGDYRFVTATLSPRAGFVSSWGFTACQLYGLAIDTAWILSVGLAPACLTLGVALGAPGLTNLGRSLAAPTTVLVGTTALIVVYFVLACNEVAVTRFIIYPLFALGLLGPLLILFLLLTHSHDDFVAGFNAFVFRLNGRADAYSLVLNAAHQAGLPATMPGWLGSSLKAVPLGFFCFLGFTYSVYIGGEVREPMKSQVRGILYGLALGGVVFLACMMLYVRVVGAEFHSAIGFSAATQAVGLPGNSMNLLVAVLAPSALFNIVMQVGTLVWFLLVPYVILQVCVHNMIAWAQDHMLPAKVLIRGSRSNAPYIAAMSACAVGVIIAVANYFLGFTLVGAAALAAVTYFITGLAGLTLPRLRPDVFQKGPEVCQSTLFGLSVFQWCALLSILGFGWILYAAIRYPEISGGSRLSALGVLAVVYLSGLVVYEVGKHRFENKAKVTGVNIAALYHEIPDD